MTATSPSLLIAEQDDVARLFLADNLGADDYRPLCAGDPRATMELLTGLRPSPTRCTGGPTAGGGRGGRRLVGTVQVGGRMARRLRSRVARDGWPSRL